MIRIISKKLIAKEKSISYKIKVDALNKNI